MIFNFTRENTLPLVHQDLPIAAELPVTVDDTPFLVGISLDQAKRLFDAGTIFVDAREKEFYLEGHIPGAWSISTPLELAFKLDSLQGKNGIFVSYCGEDECGSSEDLAYTMQDLGFTKIYIYKGGWIDWVNAGMPIAK